MMDFLTLSNRILEHGIYIIEPEVTNSWLLSTAKLSQTKVHYRFASRLEKVRFVETFDYHGVRAVKDRNIKLSIAI